MEIENLVITKSIDSVYSLGALCYSDLHPKDVLIDATVYRWH